MLSGTKMSKLLLVYSALSTCNAFSPDPAFTGRRLDRNRMAWNRRRRVRSVFELQDVVLDAPESNELVDEQGQDIAITKEMFVSQPPSQAETLGSDSYIGEEILITTSDGVSVDAQDSTVDVGKEVFLAGLDQISPGDVLQMETGLVGGSGDMLQMDTGPLGDNSEGGYLNEIESKDELGDETGLSTVSNGNDEITDTVTAILAASEEAMAAAEASLSNKVDETIESLADGSEAVSIPTFEPATEDPVTEDFSSTSVVVEPEVPVSTEDITTGITAPSVMKILKFAVPAIGVWLCGPLLSLIDTSTVGVLSGTTQQAALNPAVAVTDYAALLIAFLFTGTTNLIAAAQETDRGTEESPKTSKTLIGALQLSTFVGAGLGAVLFAFARTLLRSIIGNDAISPAVFAAAMKYVRIRALGMPAAAVIGSAQAACLGMQDIRSPLYVLLAAAVVNFFGDMMFVGCSHPLIGGAAGAAWATVFSQYAAVGLFMHWLCNRPQQDQESAKPPVLNLSKAILELTGKPSSAGEGRRKRFRDALRSLRKVNRSSSRDSTASSGIRNIRSMFARGGSKTNVSSQDANATVQKLEKPSESGFSVRGFLSGKFRSRELLKLPSRETAKEFAPYVAPVTSTQVGRVSGYVAMSHVVSSSLGTVSMAAQQVIVSLFYCLCPIADSLSLTAQSFVPSIAEKKPSQERANALRRTGLNFLKAGGVFGALMVGAVSCIPLLSGFFTSDPTVVGLVNVVVPLLIGIFSVHGLVCSAEGLLLGQKDLSFLGRMYAAFFCVVPYFMLRVKRAALSPAGSLVNLTSVWKVFLGYQLFRAAAWLGRTAIIQRRTDREAAKIKP